MTENTLRLNTTNINSLRLCKLFGYNSNDYPDISKIEWFYNGSVKFETDKTKPRIFQELSGAIKYFTKNLPMSERSMGQFVTFAKSGYRNWVLYVYVGPNNSDIEYSTPNNWIMFGNIQTEPITELSEALLADTYIQEMLTSNNTLKEVISNNPLIKA